jgi:hypothetical protein
MGSACSLTRRSTDAATAIAGPVDPGRLVAGWSLPETRGKARDRHHMALGRNGCLRLGLDRVRRGGCPPHGTGIWPATEVAESPEQVQGTHRGDLQPGPARTVMVVVAAARLVFGHHAATAPSNNKMQQTRSGHPRWRPSLLILVLARRQASHPDSTALEDGVGRGLRLASSLQRRQQSLANGRLVTEHPARTARSRKARQREAHLA